SASSSEFPYVSWIRLASRSSVRSSHCSMALPLILVHLSSMRSQFISVSTRRFEICPGRTFSDTEHSRRHNTVAAMPAINSIDSLRPLSPCARDDLYASVPGAQMVLMCDFMVSAHVCPVLPTFVTTGLGLSPGGRINGIVRFSALPYKENPHILSLC